MRDGWRETTLGEVADTLLGKTLARGGSSVEGGQPYLRNVNVQWGRVSDNALNEMIFSEAERELYELKAGDILMCEGGEVGRLALLKEDLPGVYFQNALHRVRASAGDEPGFIALALEHLVRSGGLEGLVRQVTIAHLNQRTLRQLPIALPPLDEQRRIVDLIAAVDDAVDAAEAEADRLDDVAAAVLLSMRDIPRATVGSFATLAYGKALKEGDRLGGAVPVFGAAGEVGRHSASTTQEGPAIVVGRKGVDARGRFRTAFRDLPSGVRGWGGAGSVRYSREPVWVIDTAYAALPKTGLEFRAVYWALVAADLPSIATKTTLPGLSAAAAHALDCVDPELISRTVLDVLDEIEAGVINAINAAESLRVLRSNLLTVLLSGEHEIPASYDALLEEVA